MASLHQPISPPPPDPGSAADWGALSQRVLARVGSDPYFLAVARIAGRTGARTNRLAALLEWTAP
jgi:hypothetical protein